MPQTRLIYYAELDETVPIIVWLAGLPAKRMTNAKPTSPGWSRMDMNCGDRSPITCGIASTNSGLPSRVCITASCISFMAARQ